MKYESASNLRGPTSLEAQAADKAGMGAYRRIGLIFTLGRPS